jgi:thymidylate kinase
MTDALPQLAQALAIAGVRYCRWKRSLDLQRVLSGEGDLDLLVDRKHAETFCRVAAQLGFKQASDAFDLPSAHELHLYHLQQETGALLHLHVNLTLFGEGSPFCNRIPSLEELVQQHSSVEDDGGLLAGMPVVQPQAEVLIFVLRTMELYSSLRASFTLRARQRSTEGKLTTLLSYKSAGAWQPLLERWVPSVPPALFSHCLEALRNRTSWFRRYRLARQLRKLASGDGERAERSDRSRFWRANHIGLLVRRGLAFCGKAFWRVRHGRGSPKQLAAGGAVIAFVGPDASGKSTMVAETTRWLGTVFRVQTAHLGKPPPTWLTLLPCLAWWLLRMVVPRLKAEPSPETPKEGKSKSPGFFYRLRAVLLAWDRRALAVRLSQRAARGWLVVCDRYPSAVVGAPDGARLKAPEDEQPQGWLRSCLARLENRLYREAPPPNVVVRLQTPLAVAMDRNLIRVKAGKESNGYLARRHKDFFLAPFDGARTVELDAGKSQTETVQTLRRVLWELLE